MKLATEWWLFGHKFIEVARAARSEFGSCAQQCGGLRDAFARSYPNWKRKGRLVTQTSIILATLVVYKVTLVAIGVWAARRASASEADFLLGGRALGPWVAGLSYAATSSSAWVLLGFSGAVYAVGVSALWMLPGIWLAYVAIWAWLGRRVNTEARAQHQITFVDFLVADLADRSKIAIARLAAALILFCFTVYIAAQIQAGGAAMNAFFGLSVAEGAILGAVVIVIYSVLGGFWAVSVTDTVQGMVMGVIAVLAPVAALVAAGGPGAVIAGLAADHPGHLDPFGGRTGWVALGAILGVGSVGLGTFGQPQLVARVMAVRDDRARRRSLMVALTWAVAVYSGMAVLGLSARAASLDVPDGERVLFAVIETAFPAVIAGVALAALLSAIMSTVDSILLSAAGAVSHDMGLARIAPRRSVLIARLVVVAIAGLAVWLTLTAPATIFDRVLFAWSALGAAFGPILIARVLNWRPAAWAVAAAMLVGFGLAVGANQVWGAGPGAVLERLFPWMPAFAVLYLGRRRAAP